MAVQKFSIAHLTLLQLSPPELIEVAAAAGYDYVSLRTIPMGLPGEAVHALHTDRDLFSRTRAALRSTGLQLLDIELARILDGVDVRGYEPAMAAAAELGCRHVLCSVWSDNGPQALASFVTLCELAQQLGMTVDCEFMSFASCRTLTAAAALVRASGCTNAGICIDTLHFDRSGGSLSDLASLPRAWFHYAQLADGPVSYRSDNTALKQVAREARLLPGEGGIDIAAILRALPALPVALEMPNLQRLAAVGPLDYARQCLEQTRRYLAAHTTPDSVSA